MHPPRASLALVLSAAAAAAACGPSPRPTDPALGNQPGDPGTPAAAPVAVDPARLGALGLATSSAANPDLPYWVPVNGRVSVVAPPEAALTPGDMYPVIGPDGIPAILRAGEPTEVPYGCDENTASLQPLQGNHLTPGVAWILPAGDTARAWTPGAEKLAVPERTRDRAHWIAGPVSITLDRVDDQHATLTVRTDGAAAYTEPVETYFMHGAEPRPLDLAGADDRFPGIPTPVAVFRVSDAGPHLVVLDRSGYEGVAFDTVLVTRGAAARKVDALALMLYYCAF